MSSVEAWFSTALDIEEVLTQIGSDQLHVTVANVIKLPLIGLFLTVLFLVVQGCLLGLGRCPLLIIVSVRLRLKLASGLERAVVSDGMVASHRVVL